MCDGVGAPATQTPHRPLAFLFFFLPKARYTLNMNDECIIPSKAITLLRLL